MNAPWRFVLDDQYGESVGRARMKKTGNVEAGSCKSSLNGAQLYSVQIYGGFPIDAFEVEPDVPSLER